MLVEEAIPHKRKVRHTTQTVSINALSADDGTALNGSNSTLLLAPRLSQRESISSHSEDYAALLNAIDPSRNLDLGTSQTLMPALGAGVTPTSATEFSNYLGVTLTSSNAVGWDPPRQNGDNMDDIFGWLFNEPIVPVGTTESSMSTLSAMPGTSGGLAAALPNRPTSASIEDNTQQSPFDDSLPKYPDPSNTVPLPVTPFTVFNKPVAQPPPVFSPEWRADRWPLPEARDTVGEEARSSLLEIFEASSSIHNVSQVDPVQPTTRDLVAPVFTRARMAFYLELYHLSVQLPSFPPLTILP